MNRLLQFAFARCGSVKRRSALAFELFERSLRSFLLTVGIPVKKEFLVLRCYEGSEGSGLFSEFRVLLGMLEHYERRRNQYAGLCVDFATGGLFYESASGTNWWEYYFEPVNIRTSDRAVMTEVTPYRHQFFAEEGERLSRARGVEIVEKYIRPKQCMRDKVDAYVRDHFQGAFVVGLHYRGTNKCGEAPRVPYERAHAAVIDAIKAFRPGGIKVFIATDEQAFLNYMKNHFPSGLLYREMFRSVDGRPIDEVNEENNYKKGEDAVIDCLLLSRCQFLVRTESNLSVCSTLFNPKLPQLLLNRPHA